MQTDRGFGTSHTTDVTYVPVSIDMATGMIKTRKELKHRFLVRGEQGPTAGLLLELHHP